LDYIQILILSEMRLIPVKIILYEKQISII